MTKSVSAQGFTLNKDQAELINRKLSKLDYADSLIIDLILHVKEDKKFYFDATVNFRWGGNGHVTSDDYDFAAGINKLIDILDQKVKKEKEKIQSHNWTWKTDTGLHLTCGLFLSVIRWINIQKTSVFCNSSSGNMDFSFIEQIRNFLITYFFVFVNNFFYFRKIIYNARSNRRYNILNNSRLIGFDCCVFIHRRQSGMSNRVSAIQKRRSNIRRNMKHLYNKNHGSILRHCLCSCTGGRSRECLRNCIFKYIDDPDLFNGNKANWKTIYREIIWRQHGFFESYSGGNNYKWHFV